MPAVSNNIPAFNPLGYNHRVRAVSCSPQVTIVDIPLPAGDLGATTHSAPFSQFFL